MKGKYSFYKIFGFILFEFFVIDIVYMNFSFLNSINFFLEYLFFVIGGNYKEKYVNYINYIRER